MWGENKKQTFLKEKMEEVQNSMVPRWPKQITKKILYEQDFKKIK